MRHLTLCLLRDSVSSGENDARWLRNRQRKEQLLAEVTRQAAGSRQVPQRDRPALAKSDRNMPTAQVQPWLLAIYLIAIVVH
ncbi:hypothetical protein AAFF27_24810 [Xylophilus sp. GW821-FHT01B05]